MKQKTHEIALVLGLALALTACQDQANENETQIAEAVETVETVSPPAETVPETLSAKERDQAYVDAMRSKPPKVDTEAEAQAAKAAINAFATELKSELASAIEAGGPLNAIEICNTRAIAIRQAISEEQGLQLSRVSLKPRNPDNAPLDWQRQVLESFDDFRKIGMDVTTLEWSDVATVDENPQFRFMKAIPTGGMCLMCHGQNIAPEVSAKLNELYPQDQATGYSEGEIRGAFVVVKDL